MVPAFANQEECTKPWTSAMLQTTWPQEPVTSEDMAMCFTQNKWASLDSAQRALCREVTLGNCANIDPLVSPFPQT